MFYLYIASTTLLFNQNISILISLKRCQTVQNQVRCKKLHFISDHIEFISKEVK